MGSGTISRNEMMSLDTPEVSTASLLSPHEHNQQLPANPAAVYRNFVVMAIFFSIHHGCVVSCLSLATTRLGPNVGAGQSSLLYVCYTGSALVGSTYIVKHWGAHRALTVGMFLYCFYVAAFWGAAHWQASWAAYTGAVLGGLGAGLVWTAQGSFFAQAAQAHAATVDNNDEGTNSDADTSASRSTASMAGIFAFFYLALELLLRSLSSLAAWTALFQIYALATIIATLGMAFVVKPPNLVPERIPKERPSASLLWYQVTAAIQLWNPSSVMPLMLGMNAVFGFESAFLNAYINGQVVPAASVGLWMAWASGVASLWSLVFARWTASGNDSSPHNATKDRKGWVLSAGAACFASVVLPFVVQPDVTQWASSSSFRRGLVLFWIYTLHGTGRATFEGTLKATFADFFAHEKEGAFANIILQNGLASSLGYFLTARLKCDAPAGDDHNTSSYCVPYNDGSYHHMGWMEVFILTVGVLAISGYWKAAKTVQRQQNRGDVSSDSDGETNEPREFT